jgi:Restriction endonuclease
MDGDNELSTEAKRTAIEVMACVPWWKRDLIDKVLRPAGVPREVYVTHLNRIDEFTGKRISKRAAAPAILAEMETRGEGAAFVRTVIEIGARWTDFHLHEREMEARAAVEKAKAFLAQLEGLEARERVRLEEQRREEKRQREREQAEALRRERSLLRMQFDALYQMPDAQDRGRLLEDFLNRFFAVFQIRSVGAFRRNEGGEQIDGAFRWDGWHYLVECKWQKKLSDIRELDSLSGKINRSGRATQGMFLSINGWSENVPILMKQNPEKSIILAHGYDLRLPLEADLNFRQILEKKIEALNLHAEPFFPASRLINK